MLATVKVSVLKKSPKRKEMCFLRGSGEVYCCTPLLSYHYYDYPSASDLGSLLQLARSLVSDMSVSAIEVP